jgi:hypothetical protein
MARGAAYGEQQDARGCRDDAKGEGGLQADDQTQGAWYPRAGAIGDRCAPHQARSGGGPRKGCLADTRWSHGGWVHRALQMPEDRPDHLALRDGRDDPQRPPLKEDSMKMEMRIDGTAKALNKGDRSRMDLLP